LLFTFCSYIYVIFKEKVINKSKTVHIEIKVFLLFLIEGSGSVHRTVLMDPALGGPKTYGSETLLGWGEVLKILAWRRGCGRAPALGGRVPALAPRIAGTLRPVASLLFLLFVFFVLLSLAGT
jgi:hypothetical protein